MSVYVDRLRSAPGQTGKKRWCKMWADKTISLAEMANRLNLPMGSHIESGGITYFEITPSQCERALKNGALIFTVREWKYEQKRKEKRAR